MTKKRFIFGLTALLMLVTACFAFVGCNDNSGDRTLPDVGEMIVDGQTAYKVVIPSNATATQEYSAQQICSYFAQVTGVAMSYVADSTTATVRLFLSARLRRTTSQSKTTKTLTYRAKRSTTTAL